MFASLRTSHYGLQEMYVLMFVYSNSAQYNKLQEATTSGVQTNGNMSALNHQGSFNGTAGTGNSTIPWGEVWKKFKESWTMLQSAQVACALICLVLALVVVCQRQCCGSGGSSCSDSGNSSKELGRAPMGRVARGWRKKRSQAADVKKSEMDAQGDEEHLLAPSTRSRGAAPSSRRAQLESDSD
ncbi:hypothetical protein T439DRAFT_62162 [Meredithblackwellia eburnea MCA 4105]